METLFKKGTYRILKVFYDNKNCEVHLRELARRTDLNENSVSRFLNELVNSGVLISKKEDSVRKFHISYKFIKIIFSIFDFERFDKLSFEKKKAIQDYLNNLKAKPYCLILFGSNAKSSAKKNSDIDILEINESKEKDNLLIKKIEAERGIKLQVTHLGLKDFRKAILEKDLVLLSAINTGFPVFGKDFFYEVMQNE